MAARSKKNRRPVGGRGTDAGSRPAGPSAAVASSPPSSSSQSPASTPPGDAAVVAPVRRPAAADWVIAAVLAVLTIVLFFPNTANEFLTVDDNEYVADAPMVVRGLTWDGVYWAFTSQHFYNWLPVTTLSHMLDVELYGIDSFGHHLTNILLHGLNAALVYVMFLSLMQRRWPSVAAAVLFAVHPLRVESVAWLAERKDLLAATFFLLSVIVYVGYVRRPAWWRYLLVLVLVALGLMSKTMVVTLPCVLLLLDVWPLKRWRFGKPQPDDRRKSTAWLIAEKVPMFALVVAAAVWTIVLQRYGGATQITAEVGFGQRLANAVIGVWRYIGKLIAPTDLSPFYIHPGSWPVATAVLAGVGLVVVTALAVLLARRKPYLLVGWLWFLGMLFPVSGVLLHAGRQSIADRYMYLPGLGLLMAIVWIVADWVRTSRARQAAAAAVTAVLAVVYGGVTANYQHYWQNDLLLFQHALHMDDRNWFASQVVGRNLRSMGQIELAADYFRRSLEVEPANQQLRLEFATMLLMMGPSAADEAAREFHQLVKHVPNQPGAWVGLARAELMAGHVSAAEAAFAEAGRRWPDNADVLGQWSLALARMGRTDEARDRATRALQIDPANEAAQLVLQRWPASRPAE